MFSPSSPIYLDYNATTPVDPLVIQDMIAVLSEFGNPTSSHHYGLKPRDALRLAREQLSKLIDCSPDQIIFTSGGSESNALAIFGGLKALRRIRPQANHIITSAVEHPAVTLNLKDLEGYEITILPVDSTGRVDVNDFRNAITPATVFASIMLANNEVGTIQPIREIAEICKEHQIILHSDGAQAVGKIPISVKDLQVDMLTIAAHKFYGPKGIGALYCREFTPAPLMYGACQERGLRAGTENVSGIVGLGKAAELADEELRSSHFQTIQALRDSLYQQIRQNFNHVVLNGHPIHRLPNTLSLSFPGIQSGALMDRLKDKLCFSVGAACTKSGTVSGTLNAMGVPVDIALGTIRLSVGRFTTQEQIDRTVELLTETVKSLQDLECK